MQNNNDSQTKLFYIESNEYMTCGVAMPLEKDLQPLTLAQLKLLAEKNGVSLERPSWTSSVGKTYTLTKKSDIIVALSKSSKITKKKIKEITEPVSEKKNRKPIPKELREQVWFKYIGATKSEGKCYCDGVRTISFFDFEVGHNKAVAKGGRDNINNLRPICKSCNRSMGTMSIDVYKRKYHQAKN